MTGPELIVVGILGLMVGSFLNVCIGRLPAGESVVSPGSRCPSCKTPIAWRDNIPVLSWIWLGGKCRKCGVAISPRYVIVEMITAVVFVAQALMLDASPLVDSAAAIQLASRLVFSALLVALLATDLETFRLPNPLTYTGIVAGLLFSLLGPPGFVSSLIGAALGAGLLLAVRQAWLMAKGVDALGLGDVKMLAMIGAFLGWPHVWVVLLFSSVVGAVVGIGLAIAGRGTMQSKLPFGVFLSLAAFASSLWGQRFIDWYLGTLAL
jgi:leader peptidase (prepilin peptidase) / N-methyltransferase